MRRRVTGIGGIFFKAKDPNKLYAWYERYLGLVRHPDGGVVFNCGPDERDPGRTTWAIFPESTDYFQPSDADVMINFRVDDREGLLQTLKAEGVWIDEGREDDEYGSFTWIMDPEGNRIELWQPRP